MHAVPYLVHLPKSQLYLHRLHVPISKPIPVCITLLLCTGNWRQPQSHSYTVCPHTAKVQYHALSISPPQPTRSGS